MPPQFQDQSTAPNLAPQPKKSHVRLLLLIAAALFVGGCALLYFSTQITPTQPLDDEINRDNEDGNNTILPYDSGIKGTVTIGPTCPVERVPRDPNCADKPYQASLRIKNQGGKVVIESKTNEDGSFEFSLPPGQYTIESATTSVMPSLSPVSITIAPGAYSQINLQFDSGIR